MKKLVIFSSVIICLGIAIYGFLTAPQKIEQVKLEIPNGNGIWEPQISQQIFSLVKPGDRIDPEEFEYLKETLNNLPWIKRCKLAIKNGTLIVRVIEPKPFMGIFFAGKTYLIVKNGFVLAKQSRIYPINPLYYYKGKTSPFTVKNGFIRLKRTVEMEISFTRDRINRLKIKQLKPEITITDIGVNLVFPKSRTIVYLDNTENSWNNFIKYDTLAKGLIPGIYDFRFSNLLVRGRTQCLNRKS